MTLPEQAIAFFRRPSVGLLKSFIEKLETTGAVAPSESDDPEPLTPALAAAEAAIQEAIRKRQSGETSADVERRMSPLPDRRQQTGVAVPVERRGNGPDRRSKGPAFGRRTRV
jgi:hypothetical protein